MSTQAVTTHRASLTDAIVTMFHAVDDLDWETVLSSFASEVTADYTSLWGGEPERLAAGQLATLWRQLVPGFEATQHFLGPIVVTSVVGAAATCTTNVRGFHHVVTDEDGPATWMVAGRYLIGLEQAADGWRIVSITLIVAYEEGDRRLVDIARHRCEVGTGGRARGRSVPDRDQLQRGSPSTCGPFGSNST